jgi:hypothetical protein
MTTSAKCNSQSLIQDLLATPMCQNDDPIRAGMSQNVQTETRTKLLSDLTRTAQYQSSKLGLHDIGQVIPITPLNHLYSAAGVERRILRHSWDTPL